MSNTPEKILPDPLQSTLALPQPQEAFMLAQVHGLGKKEKQRVGAGGGGRVVPNNVCTYE
jgi:hypothetical protein